MRHALLRLILSLALSLLFSLSASAAVITWDGGGAADTNWNTCANWSGNTCPGAGDIATFDNTSDNNATVNASISVAGIDINTGYDGTITQNSGVTITVGGSNFDQAAGTFAGGDSAVTVNSSFILSAGIFTSTTGNSRFPIISLIRREEPSITGMARLFSPVLRAPSM